MYKVTIENGAEKWSIHNPITKPAAAKLLSGEVIKEVNAIPSFTFSMTPNNPGFLKIWPYRTLVSVMDLRTKEKIFEGRALIPRPSMDEAGMITKTVLCEGVRAYLHDSTQPYLKERLWKGDSMRSGLEEFIDTVLGNHNAQVEDYKKVYRGIVNVKTFESSNNVTKGLNYQRTSDCLTEKLLGSFGGELDVRRGEDGKLYLDYVEEFGRTSGTPIKLGVNMKSIDQEYDPSNVVTRLIPLGAKIKAVDASGNQYETEERVTIESVNGGLNYLKNDELEKMYTAHTGTAYFDDVTLPENLKKKGMEWMLKNNLVRQKNTISALELSRIGLNYDEMQLYNYHPVKNELLGIDELVRIVKQNINVVDPTVSTLKFGDKDILSSDLKINKEKEYNVLKDEIHEIVANYDINQERIDKLEKTLKLDISSNFGAYQKTFTDGSISPDYTATPLVLTPAAYFKGVKVTSNVTYTWKRKAGSTESALITGETQDASGKLTVRHNLSGNVRYICYVTYTVSSSESLSSSVYADFTTVSDGLQGLNGKDGIPGAPGKDGMSSYTHIAYANSADGKTGFSVSDSANKLYVGMYVDAVKADSTDPTKYKWSLIKGADGANGIPGKAGADGKTPYFHIAYANSADGKTGFSVSDSANKLYIGQYTDYIQADSTDPTKYKWSLIKGKDGVDGAPGTKTIPAVSNARSFTLAQWNTYASGDVTWSNITNAADYRVNDILIMKGTVSDKNNIQCMCYCTVKSVSGTSVSTTGFHLSVGSDGRGIASYTPEYYLSTSKTTQTGGAWSTTPPAWTADQYLWVRNKIVYTNPAGTEYTTPICDTNWEAINGIRVGDRNLVLKSNTRIESTDYLVKLYNLSEDLITGETYTIVLKGTKTDGSFGVWLRGSQKNATTNIPYDEEHDLYSYTFKCPEPHSTDLPENYDTIRIYNYPSSAAHNCTIEWIKLTKGNKVSYDWTPAPEDIQQNIDDAVQEAEVKITEKYTSLIEQTSKQIDLMIKQLTTIVDGNSTAISAVSNQLQLTAEMAQFVKTTTETLQDVVTGKVSLIELKEWARFDGANLELGSNKSPFKAILTTTELGFYQGSNKVAWISNNSLYVLHAIFEDYIGVGDLRLVDEGDLGYSFM